MRPTSLSLLLSVALAVGLAAYLLAEAAYGDLPALSATGPITLGLVALVEFVMALVIRDRLMRQTRGERLTGRPLEPEQVARAGVLAKASSPTGAIFAGGYGGLLVFLIGTSTDAAADDRPYAAAAVAAALAVIGAALALERACRLPQDPEGGAESAS